MSYEYICFCFHKVINLQRIDISKLNPLLTLCIHDIEWLIYNNIGKNIYGHSAYHLSCNNTLYSSKMKVQLNFIQLFIPHYLQCLVSIYQANLLSKSLQVKMFLIWAYIWVWFSLEIVFPSKCFAVIRKDNNWLVQGQMNIVGWVEQTHLVPFFSCIIFAIAALYCHKREQYLSYW